MRKSSFPSSSAIMRSTTSTSSSLLLQCGASSVHRAGISHSTVTTRSFSLLSKGNKTSLTKKCRLMDSSRGVTTQSTKASTPETGGPMLHINTGYGPYAVAAAFLVGAANGFLVNEYFQSNKQDTKPAFRTPTKVAATKSAAPRYPMDTEMSSLPLSELASESDRTNLPGSTRRRPLDSHFIADAAKAASPSVVAIQTQVSLGRFFGVAQAFGSGFIIDQKGTIITNAHVVALVAQDVPIEVRLADGTQLEARVIASDPISDLAVLRIVNGGNRQYQCAKIGSSADLCPGEWVTAIGSPLTLQNSVSCGVISNVDRPDFELGIDSHMSYLQFDAGITSGNSGGPLVNLDGEVVGVNCMKAEDSTIGFAIPIDKAKDIIKQLLEKGKVERPFLGITMMSMSPPMKSELKRAGFKLPDDTDEGVLVVDIIPGGPGARAGLKPDDIIVSIDGKPVRTSRDVIHSMGEPGKPIKIIVKRGNREIPFDVVTDVLPEDTRRRFGGMGRRFFP